MTRSLEQSRFYRFLAERRRSLEEHRNLDPDHLYDHCAVFGIYTFPSANSTALAPRMYQGLKALQHRGQDSSGIVVTDPPDGFHTKKGNGLVPDVYNEHDLQLLHGYTAVGHNRYATVGGIEHVQPVTTKEQIVALAHNGTLPETKSLEKFLTRHGVKIQGLNDSELMQRVLEYHMKQGFSIEDAILQSYDLFTGAFSLIVATKDKLIGMKDRFGIRPLALGKLPDGYILSSETCAIDAVGGKFAQEVQPGEMVVIDNEGVHRRQIVKGERKLDLFEFVYFSKRESILYGKKVSEVRQEMGRQLAREKRIDADVVIGVPSTAVDAATGYAEQSGIPYNPQALTKKENTHRTFIHPPQDRMEKIRQKYNINPNLVKGKRVILIDDSIVRGPTAKSLVQLLYENGAVEVHFLSASPPVRFPDFYGIATPQQKELIASHMTIDQIRKYIAAASLQYLSLEGAIKSTGLPESMFNTSCFTGNYPIPIGDSNRRRIKGLAA